MPDEFTTEPTITTLLEALQQGFAQINSRLDRIETRLAAIETWQAETDKRLDRIEKRLNAIEKGIGIISHDIHKIRVDLSFHDERLDKLEEAKI